MDKNIKRKSTDLLIQLVRQKSVTPDESDCLNIIAKRLEKVGFKNEFFKFGKVNNLYSRMGTKNPVMLFAGHTDVVPTGDEAKWQQPPFSAKNIDGKIWGRGTADMKGGIAAFVVAVEQFLELNITFDGSIAFLITADEEADAIDGTVKVVDILEKRSEKIDCCLLGEPSSQRKIADEIKIGRRGSLSVSINIIGKQGHVAYPHLANNPIHKATAFLNEMCHYKWDNGDKFFPPTSFQISNIKAGTGANNVIPANLNIEGNFRFSTVQPPIKLQEIVDKMLQKHNLKYDIKWSLSGYSFISKPDKLVAATTKAIEQITEQKPKLSTTGGTSDGRFISKICPETIELGLLNATIHQVNEHIKVKDLLTLTKIYLKILQNYF
jgi:succinyl-diaminopimelate desuccinylase